MQVSPETGLYGSTENESAYSYYPSLSTQLTNYQLPLGEINEREE
jgi:hypothetical protein